MTTLIDTITQFYPKATDCVNGHIGPTIKTWFWEQDDDRAWLMKVPRCSHCNLPIGGDDYATSEEQEAFYRGEEPN
ncbi:MAG: hypothetical protein KGL39_56460 [Patescibacteria group bacterium]|nr:hypothetical protein [Patescibacteria group bacterium]